MSRVLHNRMLDNVLFIALPPLAVGLLLGWLSPSGSGVDRTTAVAVAGLGSLCAAFVTLNVGRRLESARQAGVQSLEEGIRRLAGGDLAHRVQLAPRDEVGQLAVRLNEMADEWQKERAVLSNQAFTDPITHLANRALFRNRLTHALARAERYPESLAVLLMDLDGFKTINDTLGHATGDEVLVAVAERLNSCLRAGDTAARFGGDEFAVLLEVTEDVRDAEGVADRIIDSLRAPIRVRNREVLISTSIGIAMSGSRNESAEDLLRNADVAMYIAKERGKGRYVVFAPSMHKAVLARLELESDLQRALEHRDFALFYQPIVSLQTGRIAGIEVLVRWQHPTRGMVPAAEFVPVAEETGLILPMGRWILAEACRQARLWQERYGIDEPLKIAVNLSARQLQVATIVEEMAEALRVSGLNPSNLVLEITESVVMLDTETTLAKLHGLKNLGIRLAIDDFGTGYSSLNHLRRFPFDIVKIDKSFFYDADREDAVLVRAIIELAHTLGLETVAEGIEHPEQLSRLRELRCPLAQGHFFAPPLDATDLNTYLDEAASTLRAPVLAPA